MRNPIYFLTHNGGKVLVALLGLSSSFLRAARADRPLSRNSTLLSGIEQSAPDELNSTHSDTLDIKADFNVITFDPPPQLSDNDKETDLLEQRNQGEKQKLEELSDDPDLFHQLLTDISRSFALHSAPLKDLQETIEVYTPYVLKVLAAPSNNHQGDILKLWGSILLFSVYPVPIAAEKFREVIEQYPNIFLSSWECMLHAYALEQMTAIRFNIDKPKDSVLDFSANHLQTLRIKQKENFFNSFMGNCDRVIKFIEKLFTEYTRYQNDIPELASPEQPLLAFDEAAKRRVKHQTAQYYLMEVVKTYKMYDHRPSVTLEQTFKRCEEFLVFIEFSAVYNRLDPVFQTLEYLIKQGNKKPGQINEAMINNMVNYFVKLDDFLYRDLFLLILKDKEGEFNKKIVNALLNISELSVRLAFLNIDAMFQAKMSDIGILAYHQRIFKNTPTLDIFAPDAVYLLFLHEDVFVSSLSVNGDFATLKMIIKFYQDYPFLQTPKPTTPFIATLVTILYQRVFDSLQNSNTENDYAIHDAEVRDFISDNSEMIQQLIYLTRRFKLEELEKAKQRVLVLSPQLQNSLQQNKLNPWVLVLIGVYFFTVFVAALMKIIPRFNMDNRADPAQEEPYPNFEMERADRKKQKNKEHVLQPKPKTAEEIQSEKEAEESKRKATEAFLAAQLKREDEEKERKAKEDLDRAAEKKMRELGIRDETLRNHRKNESIIGYIATRIQNANIEMSTDIAVRATRDFLRTQHENLVEKSLTKPEEKLRNTREFVKWIAEEFQLWKNVQDKTLESEQAPAAVTTAPTPTITLTVDPVITSSIQESFSAPAAASATYAEKQAPDSAASSSATKASAAKSSAPLTVEQTIFDELMLNLARLSISLDNFERSLMDKVDGETYTHPATDEGAYPQILKLISGGVASHAKIKQGLIDLMLRAYQRIITVSIINIFDSLKKLINFDPTLLENDSYHQIRIIRNYLAHNRRSELDANIHQILDIDLLVCAREFTKLKITISKDPSRVIISPNSLATTALYEDSQKATVDVHPFQFYMLNTAATIELYQALLENSDNLTPQMQRCFSHALLAELAFLAEICIQSGLSNDAHALKSLRNSHFKNQEIVEGKFKKALYEFQMLLPIILASLKDHDISDHGGPAIAPAVASITSKLLS